MKRIICLFAVIMLTAMPLFSCGESVGTTYTHDTQTSPAPDDTADSADAGKWIIPPGVETDGDTIINTSTDEPSLLLSASELPDDFMIEARVSVEQRSYIKLYFESTIDEKGQIASGISVSIDNRTGIFIVHSYDKSESKKLSSEKITATASGDYIIKVNRNGKMLDCTLYDENDQTIPLACSALSLKNQKGKQNAIAMLGDVSINAYSYGEPMNQTEHTYTNPVLTTGYDLGDPTAYYEDGKYYVLTTGRFNCYVTEDLVNYKDIGVIADKESLYGHTYFGGGSIFKHEDVYYLFYTSYIPNTERSIMCVATSDSVTGPYTQPKQTTVDSIVCPESSAGAFPFVDEDGITYLYWYQTTPEYGNCIYGAEVEFSNGTVNVKAETKKLLVTATEPWETKSENGASGRVVERPNVYFHDGYYYLFYAGSHWKTSYGQGYAVSKTPLGDFEKYENNPILDSTSSLHGVGCSYIVASPDGSELFLIYHAHTSVTSLARNICIDRIYFEENGDSPDIAKVIGPTVTPQRYPNK